MLARLHAAMPEYGRAWQEAGHLARARGRDEEALSAYARAVRFNPALIASWTAQAELFAASGRTDQAADAREQAQRIAALEQLLAEHGLSQLAAQQEMAAKLEAEREARVAHLQTVAARRIGQQGLSRGWEAWASQHYEMVAKRQMMQAAAARLLVPKLSASFAAWKGSWAAELRATLEAPFEVLVEGL